MNVFNVKLSISQVHDDCERFGRQCESIDRVVPDVYLRLQSDGELLEDVGQGEEYQRPAQLLSQTSSLPNLDGHTKMILVL